MEHKKLNTVAETVNKPFASGGEVLFCVEKVIARDVGIPERLSKEKMDEASATLQEAFERFDARFKRMAQQELEMAKRVKEFTSSTKNYTAQVGDAMARIDKLVVHEFERKLELLERFVAATKTLSDLHDKGYLSKISEAINK